LALFIDGISEPNATHLLKDPLDALAKLLPDTKIGAYARNPGVTREATNLEWLIRVREAGESPGTLDLDSIWIYLDPEWNRFTVSTTVENGPLCGG
jgi:hypothetical protein